MPQHEIWNGTPAVMVVVSTPKNASAKGSLFRLAAA
jgi:hypothetical protein